MKVYPLRQKKKWEEQLSSICECGHCDYEHYNVGLHEGKEVHDQCTTCVCPKYTYEQSLTNVDSHNLAKYIEELATKDNYII